ncbi:hypothetical protein G6F65_023126 [Rhizopus arrhizus]|nr:hypothetical protein G6F65_023126 [Rhizopus arrhizus]
MAGQGCRSGSGDHRPEGIDLLPPREGQHGRQRDPHRRRAEAGIADRCDQGHARRLHRRQGRPRVSGLQPLREHHDAEGPLRSAAAAAAG